MSLQEEFQRLQKKYDELQLRVTRFSAIEQELINTRDRLDSELVMYKRLHQFNVSALKEQDINSFLQLVAEAIIDIFEVEIGEVVLYDAKRNTAQFFTEGISSSNQCLDDDCGKALLEIASQLNQGESLLLREEHLSNTPGLMHIDSGVVYTFQEADAQHLLILGGLISKANAPLYHELKERNLTIFTVFAQKVVALLGNRKKNEELRKINAELDNFVYSVSHDLRSPLMSIKGILSLVFNLEEIGPETASYLKLAEESVIRLDDTIQEILHYSRNARLDIAPEWFDVKELVENIISDNKYATEPPIQFFIEVKGNPLIYSDKARINTVLKNLIGNAVKYRNDRGESPYVRFLMREQQGQYLLSVEDNGDGIPTTLQEKVFDMFYRGTRKSSGNGLGLYLCKEIMHKLNGALTLSSTEGKGTTMTLVLPKPDDE